MLFTSAAFTRCQNPLPVDLRRLESGDLGMAKQEAFDLNSVDQVVRVLAKGLRQPQEGLLVRRARTLNCRPW